MSLGGQRHFCMFDQSMLRNSPKHSEKILNLSIKPSWRIVIIPSQFLVYLSRLQILQTVVIVLQARRLFGAGGPVLTATQSVSTSQKDIGPGEISVLAVNGYMLVVNNWPKVQTRA